MMDKKKAKYTTSLGIDIVVTGVPVFLIDEATKSGNFPSKPTYTATTAGGEEETHDHDETTLETDEDRIAWEEYKVAVDRISREQNERMMRVLMLKGVEVDMQSEDVLDWEDEMDFLEIPLPAGKHARKVKYVETRILSDIHDLVNIMELIMRQSGVPEEAVNSAVDSFQGAVQRISSSGVAA